MQLTSDTLRSALLLTGAYGCLDAYTFLARGGVFATAQTGNVIFFGIHVSTREWAEAVTYVWPILAFVAGVMLSAHIKSGGLDKLLKYPLAWAMGFQAVVLAVVGFIPESVPHSLITVTISFVAALQIGLFRSIGDLPYVAVATTGNILRLVESGHASLVRKDPDSRRAFKIYSAVVSTFLVGAVTGAVATQLAGVHAAWLPAALVTLTLVLFIRDIRATKKAG